MTHEYVIALHGHIEAVGVGPDEGAATAIAWAAGRVLAVGPDEVVSAISRGDSTFLDLRGCVVTALPTDPARAEALMRETMAAEPARGPAVRLVEAGLLDPDSPLQPGSPADLAFWEVMDEPGVGRGDSPAPPGLRCVAVVRAGAFTEGDEHRGPFSNAGAIDP